MAALELLLASASPRRHEILDQLGIAHRVVHVPAPEGEDEPRLPGETPRCYVCRTAREKAQQALAWLQGLHTYPRTHHDAPALPRPEHALVLTADTCVVLDGEILGKPADADDAAASLRRLSGRSHQVMTAVVLAHGDRRLEALQESIVQFAVLDDDMIARYCAGGEPMGKAGAYAIQGRAAAFVRHLSGSHSGVMGLPAYETIQLLRRAGMPV
ncbi:MAG: nucleoside triphosphate pyrophosphatase [Castellaniella sp.]